jgi:phage tail-like protein
MSFRRLIYGLVSVLIVVTAAVGGIASPASSGSGALASANQAGASHFAIVVNGQQLAVFGQLVGLTSGFETSQLEVNLGGSAPKLELPVKQNPPAVTLTRGLTASLELSDWHDDAIQNGSRAWKDADIIMFDQTAQPLARWHLGNAWPSKYAVDTLAAGGQEVAMETVTFVSERLVRVSA